MAAQSRLGRHGSGFAHPALVCPRARTDSGHVTVRIGGVLLAALVTGCAMSSSPSTSPAASASPERSEPRPTGSTAPLDLSSIPIWRIWWTDGVAEPEDALRVGSADGTITARIKTGNLWFRSTARVVRGPVAGEVLYGRMVVDGIDLHLVGASTGVDRVVGQIPSTAQDAVIGPGADAIYWIDGSPDHGGAWRLDVATGERTLVLARVEVAAAPSGTVLAATVEPSAQVAISADGQRLAALWCGVERCILQLIGLANGAIEAMELVPMRNGPLFGFVDEHVVSLAGACADVAAQRLIEQDCAAGDAFTFAAIWAESLELGAELPAGWRLGATPVQDTTPMMVQPVAVPLAGGNTIPLEALGIGTAH
jgi:hypothetical protein